MPSHAERGIALVTRSSSAGARRDRIGRTVWTFEFCSRRAREPGRAGSSRAGRSLANDPATGDAHAVLFSAGPYYYVVAAGYPSDPRGTPSAAGVAAAAETLYLAVTGCSAPRGAARAG
jgi:hypothetical protein